VPYRLRHREDPQNGIRRIVSEQIAKALHEIGNDELDDHETVHQVRKRCKKIRAVLRLVRPAVGSVYSEENRWYRDLARGLSRVRDAQTLIDTFDSLREDFSALAPWSRLETVRETLQQRRRTIAKDELDLRQRLDHIADQLRSARNRLEDWQLHKKGFRALAGGLKKTYCRGRKALAAAYEMPSTERFHEWRKRVKYHWYHTRILRDLWRPVMVAQQSELDRLATLLGNEHDLAVFYETLFDETPGVGAVKDVKVLVELAEQKRVDLQNRARPLGERVFAEEPKRFVKRRQHYWKIWHAGFGDPKVLCTDATEALLVHT
jgi:CHAD domain-containing protein